MLDTRITATDDDARLMEAVRTGVLGCFDQLFERYREPVWRFFRRRVRDAAHAEELAQDVFAAVLDAAPRYEARAPFRSYLFGVAYNILLAYRRRNVGQPCDALDPDALRAAAPDQDAGLWVRQALARLDPEDRDILMLREYDQFSYLEIAEILGIPLNTVRSRLFRARLGLKAALSPERAEAMTGNRAPRSEVER